MHIKIKVAFHCSMLEFLKTLYFSTQYLQVGIYK